MTKKQKVQPPFPTKDELRRYIVESPRPIGKREIARAFHIKGEDRPRLKALLRELEADGVVEKGDGRRLTRPEGLPEITVIEIIGTDSDGELLAEPHRWRGDGPVPKIYVVPEKRSRAALGRGDRALARLKLVEPNTYEARIMRVVGTGKQDQILGIYDPTGREGKLNPTSKRAKGDYRLKPEDAAGAVAGELVLAEIKPRRRPMGAQEVRVIERLGDVTGPQAVSLISIHEHEIPVAFPDEAIADAEAAGPVTVKGRTDLRSVPLVTIDGADARDFDDAVWAEADADPKNPGGWHILVAIADVAHYVRAGKALDRTAEERGNSVYFPDRVVPMLPEALSNGWCSLRPDEERGCLVCEMWLDKDGRRLRHRFLRGIMRSAARLTYEQVQAAVDGAPDEVTAPLLEPVIKPLYGAFSSLLAERESRGTLDLDLPERRVLLDEAGKVKAIEPRARLDSHRLIEEFMISANVAAAITLEEKRQPCMYRVHEGPDPAKVEALREFLDSIGLRLAKGQVIRPGTFNRLLGDVQGTAYDQMVNELVLRCQSQAYYGATNLGHFGLSLTRYAHFTSPIRRYSDLLVHRALIRGLKLGEDGLDQDQEARFDDIADHISRTERRAAAAEREAIDRFTAAFLSERVGEIFEGRINGVTRFGLFVTLRDSGADGLVPISSLPQDYYDHVETAHALIGRRWGREFRLGETVSVRLVEVNPITGGIVMQMIEGEEPKESDFRPLPDRNVRQQRPTRPSSKGGRSASEKKRSGTRKKSRDAKMTGKRRT